jgi:hypothetical protein
MLQRWGALSPIMKRNLRFLVTTGLLVLLAACGSLTAPTGPGIVVIVDRHGTPLQNGVLVPDYEGAQEIPHTYDKYELAQRASDANGVFHVDLDDCYWNSDNCYHFKIFRTGYDNFSMTVSKDLFPPVLKVTMVEKGSDQAPPAH